MSLKNDVENGHLSTIEGLAKGKIARRLETGRLLLAMETDLKGDSLTQAQYDGLLIALAERAAVGSSEHAKAKILFLGDLTEEMANAHGGAIGFGLVKLLTVSEVAKVGKVETVRRHNAPVYVAKLLAVVASVMSASKVTAIDYGAIVAYGDKLRPTTEGKELAPSKASLTVAIKDGRIAQAEAEAKRVEAEKATAEAEKTKVTTEPDTDPAEGTDEATDGDTEPVQTLRDTLTDESVQSMQDALDACQQLLATMFNTADFQVPTNHGELRDWAADRVAEAIAEQMQSAKTG